MKSRPYRRDAPGWRLRAQGHGPGPGTWSRERGFSLIELLMATVVMASVGTLLVGSLIAANRSTQRRIGQTLSTQLLASQLALLGDTLNQETPTSGSFPPPLDDILWTLEWTESPWRPLVEATLRASHHDATASVVTYRHVAQP